MKRIRNSFRVMAVVCAALGWWGLFYPDLTLTPDTVRIVRGEDGSEAPLWGENICSGRLYLELLEAERGDVRFRSRLLESLNAFWEAFSWEKSTKD